MSAGFNIAQQLFGKIDRATATFVSDFSTNLVAELVPPIVASLTLYFVIMGLLIIYGKIERPIMNFLWQSLRIAVIVGIALNVSFYQAEIADVIQKTPDALATALLVGPHPAGSAGELIDTAAAKGLATAGKAFELANIFTEVGIIYCCFAVMTIAATVVLAAIGCAWLLLAKVMLAILAAFGPLFICGLLFNWSRGFFDRWLSSILSYVLLIVMFSAIFGMLMSAFGTFESRVAFDGVQNQTLNVGAGLILSFASVLICWQLPSIASSLAAGCNIGVFHESRQIGSAARGAYGAGAAVVNNRLTRAVAGGAVQGVAAGGRAVAGGARAMHGYFRGKGGRG